MGSAQDTAIDRPDQPERTHPGAGRVAVAGLRRWLGRHRLIAAPPALPAPDRPGNRLLRTATPLLALMLRLRGLPPPANLEGLRQRVIAAMRRFQSASRAAGVPPDRMRAAHFILCAALDDIIAHTTWGDLADWSGRGLMWTFHKTLEPGPSLTTLLDHIQTKPEAYLEELELVAVCIALGFEGGTRALPDGRKALQRLRDDIHRTIAQERGVTTPALSPSWRGTPAPRPALGVTVPIWVAASVTGALLTGLYILLAFSLGHDADHAFQRLAGLLPDRPAQVAHLDPRTASPGPTQTAPASAPAATTAELVLSHRAARFQTALSRDIANGQVEVFTGGGGDVIRIFGPPAFTRDGDTLSRPGHELALRLATLLDHESGRVLVLGHTDNGFTPSLRFPSIIALTEARARAVARVLVAHLSAPERVDIEGHADTEPLVPNDSQINRERNRRVEIILAPLEAGQ